MPLVLESNALERALSELERRDLTLATDAEGAVEWLAMGLSDDDPLVLTRRRLQLFLWYELPRKWLLPDDELVRIPPALAELLDLAGPETASYAELCRSKVTDRMIRAEGEGCFELIDASGVEPPDTELLEWSDLMAVEEAEEREGAAVFLEGAIDRGELDPRAEGWREAQRKLLDSYLRTPSPDGSAPLDRIHAARVDAWLGPAGVPDDLGGERRATLELVVPLLEGPEPSEVEAAAAIEPLLWLLALLADGVELTQTNALARSVVRAAVDRYTDWWDTEVVGPPYREAEIVALETLHSLAVGLKLARRRGHTLRLTPRGRALRDDPIALFRLIVGELAAASDAFPPGQLDVGLATLLTETATSGRESDAVAPWLLVAGIMRLLGPFAGITGKYPEPIRITPAGRTLALAILRARATGPRHAIF